jgi:hypothetical protein
MKEDEIEKALPGYNQKSEMIMAMNLVDLKIWWDEERICKLPCRLFSIEPYLLILNCGKYCFKD